jgi:hypothetical protein
MDLADLFTRSTAETGVEMKLLHPGTGEVIKNDDGKDWVVTVAGTDSDRWKATIRTAARKRGQSSDDGIETMSSLVIGWKNLVLNKEPLKFTPQAAIKLLTDYPWIRDQVNSFASERANFLPKA